ncbi:MAG: GNAT family N-acetyltransferase [Ruminococcus sp.]|nr:GNAT family N-acetyltransferase [Ruminococcus sp.]
MEYRIADQNDTELLMDIRLKMLRTVNGLPDDYEFSQELTGYLREYFLSGDHTTCLALDSGTAVGCASISYYELMPTFDHPTGRRAHIMNVYTDESSRRKGIAKRLVLTLTARAKERGVTEISLDTTESGRPFYEKLGFRASEECMVMILKDL